MTCNNISTFVATFLCHIWLKVTVFNANFLPNPPKKLKIDFSQKRPNNFFFAGSGARMVSRVPTNTPNSSCRVAKK